MRSYVQLCSKVFALRIAIHAPLSTEWRGRCFHGNLFKLAHENAVVVGLSKRGGGTAAKERQRAGGDGHPHAASRAASQDDTPAPPEPHSGAQGPARRHITRRRVIGAIVLLLLCVVGFFVWLQIRFFIGDDLVIDLDANQTSFRITNQDSATVQARLSANKQLYCDTACTIGLVDADGTLQHEESLIVRSGQTVTRDFTLRPRERGTGQVVYSIEVSCANTPSLLCPSAGIAQRDTVLLTVNYGLSEDEATIKATLAQELRSILASLRDIDAEMLAVEEMLRSEPRLRPGQTLGELAGIGERFSTASVAIETVRALWAKEEYARARDALDDSGVDADMLSALYDDAVALRTAVQGLPAEHNALRDALHAARVRAAMLMNGHAALQRDPYISAPMLSLVERLNSTVAMYVTGDYSRYADMRQRIETLASDIATLNITLSQRENAVLLIGDAIVDDRNAAACALNMTVVLPCGDMTLNASSNASLNSSSNSSNSSSNASLNISSTTSSAASSIVSIIAVCDALSMLANVSDNASMQFEAVYCAPVAIPSIDMTALDPVAPIVDPVVESGVDITLPDASPSCCVFGDCNPCCSDASCADDPASYPVIFVHGHAFNGGNTPEYSLGAYFTSMQQALQRDGYIDAGIVTPSSTMSEVAEGEWGLSGKPVMARVTYYYNFYRNGDDYVLIAQKSENIETYSLRLNEMVNIVKHHTGKKKVNIVAHSMGGLVVRRYLQLFGEESVHKAVLIGTPNHGTEGRTRQLCGILGEEKECVDMEAGSVFLRKLDDPVMRPERVQFTTIAGTGCTVNGEDADGVATAESVALDFADNHLINGSCEDLFGTELHSKMLDVVAYPQVYAIVRDTLAS